MAWVEAWKASEESLASCSLSPSEEQPFFCPAQLACEMLWASDKVLVVGDPDFGDLTASEMLPTGETRVSGAMRATEELLASGM